MNYDNKCSAVMKISFYFQGSWRESEINDVPNTAGVFFVYVGTYKPFMVRDMVHLESVKKAKNEIRRHKLMNTWKRKLRDGEELFFSVATVKTSILEDKYGLIKEAMRS